MSEQVSVELAAMIAASSSRGGRFGARTGASLGGVVNTALNYFLSNGTASPWKPPSVSPVHVYNAATNTTWFHWQAQRGPAVAPPISTVQDIRVTTYNHTTNAWGPSYILGTHTILTDVHGVPTAAQDAAGRTYVFYGDHQSAIRIAGTVNANDPSLWVDTQTYGDTTIVPVTQPKAYFNSSTGNIELYYVGKAANGNLQAAIQMVPFTPVGDGTLTAGTAKTLWDFGILGWSYPGSWHQAGTKIYMNVTGIVGANIQQIYVGVYDQVTGNIASMDGGIVIAPASQPIIQTTAQASFMAVSLIGNSITAQVGTVYDGTTLHVVYGQQDNTSLTPPSTNPTLRHVYWTGSAWSSPTTIYSFATTMSGGNAYGQPIINSTGGIDVYFPDGTWPGTGQYSYETGNIMRATRSSGGVWSAATTFLAATTRGLGVPAAIHSGNSAAALAFAEESNDAITAVGALKGYVVGNNGAYLRYPVIAPSQLFLNRTSGLDATHTTAYRTLIDGLVSDGVWPSLVMLYVLATQDSATARLNLVSGDWTLLPVNSPTFTTDRGYASDGTTSYLDTGGISAPAGANVWNFVKVNDCSMFGWTMTHSNGTGNQWGTYAGGTAILATPKNTSQMTLRHQRGSGADVTVGMATDIGFFGASRTSSATVDVYENAIQHIGIAQVSGANPNANLWIGGTHAASFDTAQVGAVGFGAGMTTAQMTALYNRLHKYMQTIAGVA